MILRLFFYSFIVSMFIISMTNAQAAGVVPDSSIVIVEEGDNEGAINVTNTDNWPVLMLTTLQDIPEDAEKLLMVTPPAARVEPGKTQRVRFMLNSKQPLKTERLKRVTFEGIPPVQKGKNEVRMTVRQNLPVLIRPAGLAKEPAPWTKLTWEIKGKTLVVSNPSPYVVRIGQTVQTIPDNTAWTLPQTYVLPGQTFTMTLPNGKAPPSSRMVRLSPATTWGFAVDTYDAVLTR